MAYQNYKKIIRVITIALTLLVSVFVATGVSAQEVDIPVSGANPNIDITAVVRGCGNGIIESDLGEQCEGGQNNIPLDTNGGSCIDLGFSRGGTLGCRVSCIYDTSLCNGSNSSSNERRSGGRRRIPETQDISDTNIIFTGQGEPGSTFFVLADGDYLDSTLVSLDGSFTTTVSDPAASLYDFTFYTISPNGLFGPHRFTIDIKAGTTTFINNIFVPFSIPILETEEELFTLDTPLGGEVVIGDISTEQDIPRLQQKQDTALDIFTTLDQLVEGQDLSRGDQIRLVEDVVVQNTARAENGWRKAQSWLTEKTGGLNRWYPNVYLSFMVPYWDIPYDLTSWFDKYRDPFGAHYSLYSIFY